MYKWDYSIHSRYRAQWKLCKTMKFFLINTQLMAVWYEIEDLTLSITTRIGKTGPKTLLAEYKPSNITQQVSENNKEEQTPMFSSPQPDNELEDETHNRSRLLMWNVTEEFKRASFDLKMEGNQKKDRASGKNSSNNWGHTKSD